ncbi:hypothetical protein CISIN_1g035497mg [Citrus sinensis]|uniref:Uncharacterized protein n=1 Tax=Citrus sinensis TaxID=2711 RepID=A0A067DQ27_CITSI|nr:hypothetical protein CISIN_1g035497mg [Citrus sinensis]
MAGNLHNLNNPSSSPPILREKDPVKVIKEAISEALVYYYPFAGRIKQGPNRKVMVDCNGEGILFLKVTRLMCGGFTLAIHFNHTMCDELGLVQFVKTIQEMARGSNTPSLFPVSQRERLCARNPPQV